MSTKRNQIDRLQSVFEVKYEMRLTTFKQIVRKEQSIRQAIDTLRENLIGDHHAVSDGMKTIGADLAWRAWVEKQITKMNMELAQVLVQKEQELHLLRKEFGRKFAGQQLAEKAASVHQLKLRRAEEHKQTEFLAKQAVQKT